MQIPLPDMSQSEDQFAPTPSVTDASGVDSVTSFTPTQIGTMFPSTSRVSSLNIPSLKATTPKVTFNGASGNDKRVKISMLSGSPAIFYRDPANTLLKILNQTNGVVFPFQPSVPLSFSSTYENQAVTHSNFTYHSYKNSEIKPFDISGDFVVRTPYEGQYVVAAIHFLRCLTMMFTGNDASAGSGKINIAGAPPLIVNLTGIGFVGLDSLPVVVTNVTTTFPDNVDYVTVALPGLNGEITKIPCQMTVNISVVPVFSRLFASQFGLQNFSNGTTRLLGPNPDLSPSLNGTISSLTPSAIPSFSGFSANSPTVILGSDNTAVSTNTKSGDFPTIETQADTSLSDIQL